MREKLNEPLPTSQINAKLVMGNTTVVCVIVATTADGFRVAVPGVEQYEGDPRLTLVTRNAIYPVRLVLQEAHVGGYSYRLQQLENVTPARVEPCLSERFKYVISRCCAAGIIGVIAASCYCIPKSSELIPLVARRGNRPESIHTSPTVAENDQVAPGISVENTLPIEDDFISVANTPDREHSTFSISLVSPASMSSERSNSGDDATVFATVHQGIHEQAVTTTRNVSRRLTSLQVLLEEGQLGRVQPASRELLKWLNGLAAPADRVTFRLSDAAWIDLQQFEVGLHGLPDELSALAVNSLRNAIFTANSDHGKTHTASDPQKVFVIGCDDASIYFRKFHGQIELVRVLPVESNRAEHP